MWVQHLEPDTPVMSLKYIIMGKTKRDLNDFRLDSDDVCRLLCVSPRTLQTLRENGITAETIIFVENNKR